MNIIMNRSVSKIFDEYRELSSQAKHPCEYTVLKHDTNEVTGIPIEPNLLFFKDEEMQNRYFKTLYIDQSTLSISKEFGYNLLTFYIYFTLMMVINLALSIALYRLSKISNNLFIFHIVCVSVLVFVFYCFLLLILKNRQFLKGNRICFCILNFIVYIYLMLGSSEIFKGLINEDYDTHLFPTLIEIIGFTYSFRRIVFDSYRHLVLTLIPMLIVLLAVSFIYRDCNFLSILGDFSAIALFVITQIVETNIVESRTIQLFYRMEKEETSHEVNLKKKTKLDQYEPENKNSLASSLEKKCDFVIKELKYASSVIIFRDVKSRLKIAQSEIVKIKNKIEKITSDTNFDIITHDLDEQDKEFIAQNFLKVSTIGRPQSKHKHSRSGFQSNHAHIAHSLVSGVQDYLSKLGQDWNFSMFYIQEKTNKTISVISTYMFAEYSLDRTLKIPEETFVSFFDSVESVIEI